MPAAGRGCRDGSGRGHAPGLSRRRCRPLTPHAGARRADGIRSRSRAGDASARCILERLLGKLGAANLAAGLALLAVDSVTARANLRRPPSPGRLVVAAEGVWHSAGPFPGTRAEPNRGLLDGIEIGQLARHAKSVSAVTRAAEDAVGRFGGRSCAEHSRSLTPEILRRLADQKVRSLRQ
jgi:hypothetical protein